MNEKFRVQLLEDAAEFLDNLDEKPREKIYYNIQKSRFSNDKELFKKLKGEIWEFRTLFYKTHYRLFAFWDKTGKDETVVISTHGIIKKTDKTPHGEIGVYDKIPFFLELGNFLTICYFVKLNNLYLKLINGHLLSI